MNPLAMFADVLPKALAAISSQLHSYVTDRLQREFVFPAVAFVLGCVALVFAIYGTELPRAWWVSLPLDLKLLVGALLAVLFVALVELNQLLSLTVRRLYSGEWPNWRPWHQFWREPLFRARRDQRARHGILERAQATLNGAQAALSQLAPGPPQKPTDERWYPVLRANIGPYQLVTEDNWEWKALTPGEGLVTSPAELLGHYTLVPLKAGETVPLDQLRFLPDERYLAGDRCVLKVDISPGEAGPHVVSGSIVTLMLSPDRAKGRPSEESIVDRLLQTGTGGIQAFSDLLVLDQRDDDRQLILSIRTDQAGTILAHLPHSHLTLVSSPTLVAPLVVAAVARKELPRGQLVQREHIGWKVVPASTQDVVVNEEDVIGKVFWGTNLGGVPSQLEPLPASQPFKRSEMIAVPGSRPFVFSGAGQPGYRAAYRLDTFTKELYVGDRTGNEIRYERLSDALMDFAIREGDLLDVRLDAEHLERWCFIYAVAEDSLFIAVEHPAEFDKTVANTRRVVISPFCHLPVMREERRRGQLIPQALVKRVFLRMTFDIVENCILDEASLDQYYVAWDGDRLLPDRPIPRASLAPLIPRGQTLLRLTPARGRVDLTDRVRLVPPDLRRDDRVTIWMESAARKSRAWRHAIVLATLSNEAGNLRRLQLGNIPASYCAEYRELWREGALARIVVAHPDRCARGSAHTPVVLDGPDRDILTLAPKGSRDDLADRVWLLPELKRGDLVSFRLVAHDQNEDPLVWEQALIHLVEVDQSHNGLRELQIAIDTPDRLEAERLWSNGATAQITLTHTDSIVQQMAVEMEANAVTLFAPSTLNALLVPGRSNVNTLEEQADEIMAASQAMQMWHGLMRERPWESLSPPQGFSYETYRDSVFFQVMGQFEEGVQEWLEALKRIRHAAQLVLPENPADIRPTELGNVLAAAADYPLKAYTIDTTSILPRLLEVLGREDTAVKNLINAEATMTMMLLFSFWTALWTILGAPLLYFGRGAFWLFPVVVLGGPLLAWVTKEAATAQAFVYGNALKSLFDLRRRRLWTALGIKIEKDELTPVDEQSYWRELYELFAYGDTRDFPAIKTVSAEEAS